MNFVDYALLMAAAFLAGGVNSIGGGGTLLSFPALVWLGRPPIIANATNSVALWPGSLAGVYGFRQELRKVQHWLLLLTIPSLLGGALGAWLLLHTSEKTFVRIVPLLILGATLLLAGQETIPPRPGLLRPAHGQPTLRLVAIGL